MDFEFEKEVNDDVIGQIFDTLGDAYDFYNRYAFVDGFGIRIRSTFKDKTTNEPYRRKYVCNKKGYKDLKRDSSKGDVKRHRELRTRCEAFLRISKGKDGKWLVDKFNDSHNHELTCFSLVESKLIFVVLHFFYYNSFDIIGSKYGESNETGQNMMN
ncbi:putative transcription factor FAR family [Helianthus debilis subsp. tardiflorus]